MLKLRKFLAFLITGSKFPNRAGSLYSDAIIESVNNNLTFSDLLHNGRKYFNLSFLGKGQFLRILSGSFGLLW